MDTSTNLLATTFDSARWAILIGAVLFMLMALIFRNYRLRKRSQKTAGSSILLSYYTNGGSLLPLLSDTKNGLHYQAFTTAVRASPHRDAVGDSALLYRFELPFRSAAHLLGVSKQSGTTQLDPSGHTLEKVSLEGNYDSYFSLYAATDMKSDTQYVLDPAAMAFTVDFCQSHNWEIIGSELYFAQESRTSAPDDKTDMWDDVDEFIRQIRPAIELPSSDLNQSHNVPVGADRRKDIQCFECEELLTRSKGYFMCPAGHGVLLQGAKLPELRRGTLTIQLPELDATVATTTKKKCPSCDSSMNLVDYAGSNVLIETCSSCPYRWLDRADLVDIADQGAI